MKLVIGLGNSGEKYTRTRHNVGFILLDTLVSRMVNKKWLTTNRLNSLIINHQQLIIFCKPQTMMNNSGVAAKKLIAHFKVKLSELWVIHDDLDLAFGNYKIQKGRGPKEHKGLLSIYDALSSKNFWHVRIGIENRQVEQVEQVRQVVLEMKTAGEEYVLQDFTKKELEGLGPIIDKIVKDLVPRLVN